ncbi:hypothetical protein LCGC14_3155500, partial [marine sediment metagenome]
MLKVVKLRAALGVIRLVANLFGYSTGTRISIVPAGVDLDPVEPNDYLHGLAVGVCAAGYAPRGYAPRGMQRSWSFNASMEVGFSERMESFCLVAYLVLAVVTLVQAVIVAVQTWEHRRYARSCMRGLRSHRPHGRAAVFAPCKGVDVDLEENLCALLRQDYDDYEVTFIVESADDPACPVIRRLMAEHPSA